jgi:hypothetical protein
MTGVIRLMVNGAVWEIMQTFKRAGLCGLSAPMSLRSNKAKLAYHVIQDVFFGTRQSKLTARFPVLGAPRYGDHQTYSPPGSS